MIKKFIYLILFTILPAFISLAQDERKPNIIVIFTDDQGYEDVGVFGARNFKTPHLDKMAEEGIQLTSFYAAQAVCSASRAALLTGSYSNRVGIHGALMPGSKIGLNPSETTLPEMLKSNGYRTAIFGKWHLGDHPDFMPTKHGFDEYFGIPYSNDMWPFHPQQGNGFDFGPLPLYQNAEIIDTLADQTNLTVTLTNKSVAFIEENKDQPFFLYLAHPQPHVPLFVSEKFKGKSEKGLYGDVVMEIDWSVGQILEELKIHDLDEQTLVIFTSDNGPWLSYGDHSGSAYPLREGKGTAWEGGQRVPCLIRFPNRIPAGKVVDIPMMTIDILPTIAAITGSKLPQNTIDGKNIWPILCGESNASPHEAYYFYYHVNELHAVRYGDWKLYFPHNYRSLNGRKGGKNNIPMDYENLFVKEIELYHLGRDLSESKNMAAQNPQVVEKIRILADKMRTELGDKLTGTTGTGNRLPGKVE